MAMAKAAQARISATLGLAVLGLCAGAPSEAAAQKLAWGDIDCSQSRFVAPASAKCRATNVYGSTDGLGQFQAWVYLTDVPWRHVWMDESQTSISHLRFVDTGEEYLRKISSRAKDATNFSARKRRNSDDYYTFTSAKLEECVGFRRGGPARSAGHKWVVGGLMCMPKGTPLDEARMFEFMDSVKLK